MFTRQLDVQRIIDSDLLPNNEQLQLWVEKALSEYKYDAEIVIRIVDAEEMLDLNSQYRGKQGTTNILSFPLDLPDEVEGVDLLGDLVICSEVLQEEAKDQNKQLLDHWAHIIIHGVLHLLGYDHIEEADALEMENKERILLQKLHIDNPYLEKEVNG